MRAAAARKPADAMDLTAGDAAVRAPQRRHDLISRAFSQHYGSLCRLGYVMTGNPALAEEVVMDVFTDTLRSWRPLANSDDVTSYLRRGVINRCNSAGRRRGVERAANQRIARASPVTVVDGPDFGDRDRVAAAVRILPKRQRAAIVLTYFLDLPLIDTAAILGCSVGTVKSQLYKARTQLATTLERQS